jgi:hypothetical protein
MKFPNKVSKGEPIKASLWNDLVDYLRSLTPRAGAGTRLDWGDSGFSYSATKQTTTTRRDACPLQCYGTRSEEDEPLIGVTWGTICGRQPTGFSASSLYTFEPAHSTGYIYAKATASLETLQWTSAEIVDNDDAFPSNTDTEAYQLIGSYVVEDGALSVESTCGNVSFGFCDLAAVIEEEEE